MNRNYKIITSESEYGVESAVNDLLKKGWKPVGGVSVSISMSSSQFAQAMMQEDK